MTTKTNILIITHNIAAKSPGGGVEIYQEHIRRIKSYNIFFLFPMSHEGKNYLVLQTPDGKYHKYDVGVKISRYCFEETNRTNVLRKIISSHNIRLVHFQHLLWLPLGFPLEVKKLGIPAIFTAHDHYLVCDKFNLVGLNRRFCNVFDATPSQCDLCLAATQDKPFGTRQARQNTMHDVVNSFDTIIVNTDYSRETLMKTFTELSHQKIETIEMLTPNYKEKIVSSRTSKIERLKVAIPGNFNYLKGADVLLQLFSATRQLPVEYEVLGRIQEPKYIDLIKRSQFQNVRVMNGYNSEEAINILERFDVSLHLSIWPETYMITINESWQANTIPIVSNLGAPAYRVENGKTGFVCSPYDLGEIYDKLNLILQNDQERDSILQNIRRQHSISPNAHLKQIVQVYQNHIS